MSMGVLVIDDSGLVRRQVASVLKESGYSVVEASDGFDALAKLGATPSTRLIVCDVNMPNMNGLEFLENLRSKNNDVPVVMLTTEGQPELIHRAKSLGEKGWIVKPFKREFLIATAKRFAPLPAA